DGYAKRDDGLMVGAVHLRETLELLCQIRRDGYGGALYFDTFPDTSGLDPVAECEANIATVRRLLAVADRLDGDNRLGEALGQQKAEPRFAWSGRWAMMISGASLWRTSAPAALMRHACSACPTLDQA